MTHDALITSPPAMTGLPLLLKPKAEVSGLLNSPRSLKKTIPNLHVHNPSAHRKNESERSRKIEGISKG